MIRALLLSVGELFSSEGAWWILALNGILLIPLVFAMFFFPVAVLIGVGTVAVLTVMAVALMRAMHAHQHTHQ